MEQLLCEIESTTAIELVTVLQADEEVVEKSNLAMAGEPSFYVYD